MYCFSVASSIHFLASLCISICNSKLANVDNFTILNNHWKDRRVDIPYLRDFRLIYGMWALLILLSPPYPQLPHGRGSLFLFRINLPKKGQCLNYAKYLEDNQFQLTLGWHSRYSWYDSGSFQPYSQNLSSDKDLCAIMGCIKAEFPGKSSKGERGARQRRVRIEVRIYK